jgi:hypothetical protein
MFIFKKKNLNSVFGLVECQSVSYSNRNSNANDGTSGIMVIKSCKTNIKYFRLSNIIMINNFNSI